MNNAHTLIVTKKYGANAVNDGMLLSGCFVSFP